MDYLKQWLDDGKITKEEYDAAIAAQPANPAAWDALQADHAAEVAKITKERDDAIAREKAKDKIITSFVTKGNPSAAPDADPIAEVVGYINKKRGFTNAH